MFQLHKKKNKSNSKIIVVCDFFMVNKKITDGGSYAYVYLPAIPLRVREAGIDYSDGELFFNIANISTNVNNQNCTLYGRLDVVSPNYNTYLCGGVSEPRHSTIASSIHYNTYLCGGGIGTFDTFEVVPLPL